MRLGHTVEMKLHSDQINELNGSATQNKSHNPEFGHFVPPPFLFHSSTAKKFPFKNIIGNFRNW